MKLQKIKKSTLQAGYHWQFILSLLAITLFVACQKESTDELVQEINISENIADSATTRNPNKRDVCHNGNVININLNAIPAHQAHGDAVDMDGDGFFDIDNPCGDTDCDDNDYDLENNCCDSGGYATVELNGKTWLAENLNIEVDNSWCYGNNPANCDTYGRLYTFASAQTACAQLGDCWRVPTKAEWDAMITVYDEEWVSDNVGHESFTPYSALIDGGESGFDGLNGGWKKNNANTFHEINDSGIYWSSSNDKVDTGWFFQHDINGSFVRYSIFLNYGFSCRCIRD